MSKSPLPGFYLTEPGVLSSPYDDTALYTLVGNNSSIELNTDPAFILTGDKSIKITCNRGSAAPSNLRTKEAGATITPYLNTRGRLGWWIYVTDYTKLTSIELDAYSTYGTARYFQGYPFADGDKQYNGWHWVSLGRNQITGVGGSPDWDTTPIVVIELRFNQNSATQTVCYIDTGYQGFHARPKCLIYADDGYSSFYTLGVPLLAARGLKANFAIIGSLIGADTYMTEANLEALYAAGHDLCVHGATQMTSLADEAARAADIAANQDFLTTRGFLRGARHYVYPNGVYQLSAGDEQIFNLLAARGFKTSRGTVSPRTFNSAYGLQRRRMVMPIIGGLATDSASAILTRVDDAIARGDNMALMFHRIVASGATGIEYNTADLTTVLDGLQTRVNAGTLDVRTVSQWYEGAVRVGGVVGGPALGCGVGVGVGVKVGIQ